MKSEGCPNKLQGSNRLCYWPRRTQTSLLNAMLAKLSCVACNGEKAFV
jgi:hypothetical protein